MHIRTGFGFFLLQKYFKVIYLSYENPQSYWTNLKLQGPPAICLLKLINVSKHAVVEMETFLQDDSTFYFYVAF